MIAQDQSSKMQNSDSINSSIIFFFTKDYCSPFILQGLSCQVSDMQLELVLT